MSVSTARPDRVLRWMNFVMATLFLLSAALQFNDPDPLRWALIYGAAGVACLLFDRIRPPWLLPSLVGVACFAWAGGLAPRVLPALRFADLFGSMKAETPSIEQSRELLGLVIIIAWMLVLAAKSRNLQED